MATWQELYKPISPAQKAAYQKQFAASYPTQPTAKTLTRKPSIAVSTPAARGLSGYIGRETAFTKPGGMQPYTITTQKANPYGGLIAGFGQAGARARQANITRQKRIESMYSEMMQRYQPGGAFEKRGLGEIETARTKGVGGEMQQMISSGMYGTTTAAGVPRKWEAEVGAPARLRLEDIMQQRLTGIQQQKAGFLERIQEPYPDYSALMSAIMR